MEIIRPQPNTTQPPSPEAPVQASSRKETAVNDAVASTPNAPETKQPEEASPPAEDLQSVVREISNFIQNQQREIQFEVSETSGRTIIQVYDKVTDELIREIPSEEVQRISQAIRDELESGLLLKLEV